MLKSINAALYLLKDKKKLIVFTLVNLAISLSDILSISLIAGLFVNFISPNKMLSFFFINIDYKFIFILLIIIFLLKILFISFSSYYLKNYLENQSINIKLAILKNVFNKKVLNFDQSKINNLVFVQINNFISSFIEPLMNLIAHCIMVSCLLFLLIYTNLTITFASFIYFIFFAFIYDKFIREFLNNLGKKAVKYHFKFSKNIKSFVEGIIEIKLYRRQNFFFEITEKSLKNIKKLEAINSAFAHLPKPYFEFVAIIYFSILFFIQENNNLLDTNFVYTLLIFGLSFLRVLPSLNVISSSFQSLRYASKNIVSIRDFVDDDIHYDNFKNKISNKEEKKIDKIILKKVNFGYKKKKILKNFSQIFSIGNIYLIHGKSGKGKSTLANLLLQFLEPANGTIRFFSNNEDVSKLENKSISLVPANVGIINDTLINNITLYNSYKKKLTTLSKILNLLRLKDISNLKLSNHKIDEEGKNLSQGQKKRISIARSIYFNKSVQIFDEATNSIDKPLEIKFFQYLKKYKKDKIIIIISHNKSLKKFSDRIINL
jgi:ABC-type multidrug transport system fused ATPase/permease subunit